MLVTDITGKSHRLTSNEKFPLLKEHRQIASTVYNEIMSFTQLRTFCNYYFVQQKKVWSMKKVQIILDEKQIIADGQYDLAKMHLVIDRLFVDIYGLVKGNDGYYLERGNKDDFADFWNAILSLKDQDWFLYNVKTWLWFNSDDGADPDDFEVEDLREHYLANAKMTA
jgi:hypothetical protein